MKKAALLIAVVLSAPLVSHADNALGGTYSLCLQAPTSLNVIVSAAAIQANDVDWTASLAETDIDKVNRGQVLTCLGQIENARGQNSFVRAVTKDLYTRIYANDSVTRNRVLPRDGSGAIVHSGTPADDI